MSLLEIFSPNEQQTGLSPLNNPFVKEGAETVWMYGRKSSDGSVIWEGWVNFKRGGTEGKHTVKGDSILSVLKQLDELIKSL